jgi:hypothetical protein
MARIPMKHKANTPIASATALRTHRLIIDLLTPLS